MTSMPSTLSGRPVAAPSDVIEMDEVFDASLTDILRAPFYVRRAGRHGERRTQNVERRTV
jgi:hypothetical protein